MKRIFKIAVICVLSLLLSVCVSYAESIWVHITVTDITDVNEPWNVLVERRVLAVDDKDLSSAYGGTFVGIETAEGITYLHALAALHEDLYGEENVKDYLMLDNQGVTHLFMGKSIDSIMYKNGDDIFALPQNVPLQSGDEVNVCIYTAGHTQQIVTFKRGEVSDSVYVTLKNAEYDGCRVWCAAYTSDTMPDVQSQEATDSMRFVFGSGADYYKVMFWNEMTPRTAAYTG